MRTAPRRVQARRWNVPDLPSQIGRYEIRKELGRGMMGVVYEVHDPALGRTIALKTIRLAFGGSGRERDEYERRFLAEARIAARLSHHGIVVVHDVGRDEEKGILFIALEYLHGRTLDQVAGGENRPDWREALRIVARIAEALDYAHAQGVVHRDIKPANIMVLPSGVPKIMDFGIAKFEAGHHTATGQFFGTPLYMAPEQALGQPVDGRTDLFSLGSVAYTLLTGRPPFEAANVPGVLARVAYQDPKPLSELVTGLPPEVDYLLARAMAKSPADRYPAARMLAEDIEDVLAGRPPRHRGGWTAPRQGERTMVSRGLGSAEMELELQLIDEQASPRRRQRRPAATLIALLLAATAAYFYLHPSDRLFWRDPLAAVPQAADVVSIASELSSELQALLAAGPEASPPPAVRPPPSPYPPPSTVAVASGAGGFAAMKEWEPAVGGPERAAGPEPSPSPPPPPLPADGPPLSPLPPPAPEKAGAAQSRGAPSAPGRLVLEFEHHIRQGNLQVWVDGRRVLDQDFDSKVVRRILSLELRKGVLQEALTLDPGRHEVRVQVRWDKNVKTSRISGTFTPGGTRHLDVDVSRLRGNLNLAWK